MEVLNLIGGGKKLPVLSNPATAAQILKGYQAINQTGEIVVGEMEPGLRMVTGGFTSAKAGSYASVNIGAQPKYIMFYGSNDSGGNVVGFALLTSSGSVAGRFNNCDKVNYVDDYSFLSKDYIVLTDNGFRFSTPVSVLQSTTIIYYAFV